MFSHGVVLSCSCSWFCNHNRLPFLVSVIKKDFVWCGSRFADLQPFRCHHDSSLMVVRVRRTAAMQMSSIIANYSLVWFSHGGSCSQSFIHVDVIMNVRSWCGSLMVLFQVVAMSMSS